MELEEKTYNEMETVREITFLGDRVSAGGGSCDCQDKMWVWLSLGSVARNCTELGFAKAMWDCLHELYKAINSVWTKSVMPERNKNWKFVRHRDP